MARFTRQLFDGLGRRFTDKRLVINQAGSFVRFAVFLIGGLSAALTVLEVTPEVLLALGGTVAVSVGFALKDLVSSIVAGLIILVDRPFQVGDRVTFDGWYGEISHIGLRSVKLVTLDDTQVTIPNNKFLTDPVASGNAGSVEMMVQMDYYVGMDQDLAAAKSHRRRGSHELAIRLHRTPVVGHHLAGGAGELLRPAAPGQGLCPRRELREGLRNRCHRAGRRRLRRRRDQTSGGAPPQLLTPRGFPLRPSDRVVSGLVDGRVENVDRPGSDLGSADPGNSLVSLGRRSEDRRGKPPHGSGAAGCGQRRPKVASNSKETALRWDDWRFCPGTWRVPPCSNDFLQPRFDST